jgi:hypothetical protein
LDGAAGVDGATGADVAGLKGTASLLGDEGLCWEATVLWILFATKWSRMVPMESMVTIWWGSLKGRNELGGRGGNGWEGVWGRVA